MNDILKIGIFWVIISVILVRLVSNPQNVFLVWLIGSLLVVAGVIVNEYQVWKCEKHYFEG